VTLELPPGGTWVLVEQGDTLLLLLLLLLLLQQQANYEQEAYLAASGIIHPHSVVVAEQTWLVTFTLHER
jgi:hypothetical protein